MTAAYAPAPNCFPRVATCFGGGMARRGEVCGALTGALLALGAVRGRDDSSDHEAKEQAYRLAAQVVEAFRHAFGEILCRELIGLDLTDPRGRETYTAEKIHERKCVEFVAEAARLAHDALRP
ncbi:MAG: C_GCAxxG_C_C family protein [Candidatus Coatesbacteria bacterium]|nr:MAG: C_GCAxxG_C_C family protein [Candidatus Coatesbacteria bacterium]